MDKALITVAQAAERWGISVRQVERLAKAGRIEGVQKIGRTLLIPETAARPADLRRTVGNGEKAVQKSYSFDLCIPFRRTDLRPVCEKAGWEEVAEAQGAYYRGDGQPAIRLYRKLPADADGWLTAATMALFAAIDAEDEYLITQIRSELLAAAQKSDLADRQLLSLPETVLSVRFGLVRKTPIWLKAYDFSLYDAELTPFLTYVYIQHLRNIGDTQGMLSAARMASRFCERRETLCWLDVVFPLMAATACYEMRDVKNARVYLERALDLALSSGFLRPVADAMPFMGGMIGQTLRRRFGTDANHLRRIWEESVPGKIRFHNRESGHTLCDALTMREYELAMMLARGDSYQEAADAFGVSVGRIRNLINSLYGKMGIASKKEVSARLWTPEGLRRQG